MDEIKIIKIEQVYVLYKKYGTKTEVKHFDKPIDIVKDVPYESALTSFHTCRTFVVHGEVNGIPIDFTTEKEFDCEHYYLGHTRLTHADVIKKYGSSSMEAFESREAHYKGGFIKGNKFYAFAREKGPIHVIDYQKSVKNNRFKTTYSQHEIQDDVME